MVLSGHFSAWYTDASAGEWNPRVILYSLQRRSDRTSAEKMSGFLTEIVIE